MKHIRRAALVLALVALLVPASLPVAFAQQSPADAIRAQIADLRAQLIRLQQSIGVDTADTPTTSVPVFTQSLRPGMQNEQVRALQLFLATLPGIYPEGITSGYYGTLTTQAVRRFQARYGLETVGVVGPQTRAQLNALRGAASIETTDIPGATTTPPPTVTVTDNEGTTHNVTVTSDALARPSYNIRALERSVQDAINRERRKRGLQELQWNEAAAAIARLHSEDQAQDNRVITDAAKPCTYPLLRHEGKTRGLTVLERTQSILNDFRRVGENIVTFPITERSVYGFKSSDGAVTCPRVDEFDFKNFDTSKERLAEFNKAKEEREEALEDVPEVTWVTRTWKSENEIVEKAVDLWLGSPGHRENLLQPNYNEAGVGIAVVNNYYIITQVFIESR